MVAKYTGIPARMMAEPTTGSNGSDQNGKTTRNVQTIKKRIGKIMFTLIGLAKSGFVTLNQRRAATETATNRDSMKAA